MQLNWCLLCSILSWAIDFLASQCFSRFHRVANFPISANLQFENGIKKAASLNAWSSTFPARRFRFVSNIGGSRRQTVDGRRQTADGSRKGKEKENSTVWGAIQTTIRAERCMGFVPLYRVCIDIPWTWKHIVEFAKLHSLQGTEEVRSRSSVAAHPERGESNRDCKAMPRTRSSSHWAT